MCCLAFAKGSCRLRRRIWKWNWWRRRKWRCRTAGDITVPGRKFLDILRALPEKVSVSLSVEGEKVVIKAGRSRFSLSTLPAADFPVIDDINSQQTVQLPRKELLRLLEKTHFSMAQQDVRYYLNGMLLEIDGQVLRAVATDGHRLALVRNRAGREGQELAASDCAAQRRVGVAAGAHR